MRWSDCIFPPCPNPSPGLLPAAMLEVDEAKSGAEETGAIHAALTSRPAAIATRNIFAATYLHLQSTIPYYGINNSQPVRSVPNRDAQDSTLQR